MVKSKGCKWNVWSLSVIHEKQAVFSMCYYFCGSWIWKDINRVCSLWGAELRCSDNAEQGAHLRQPCLLSEPRDQAWCLGEHRKASPMMHSRFSTAWGITSKSHGAHYIHSHFPQWFAFSCLPSLQCEWIAQCHWAKSVMSQFSCGNVNNM